MLDLVSRGWTQLYDSCLERGQLRGELFPATKEFLLIAGIGDRNQRRPHPIASFDDVLAGLHRRQLHFDQRVNGVGESGKDHDRHSQRRCRGCTHGDQDCGKLEGDAAKEPKARSFGHGGFHEIAG